MLLIIVQYITTVILSLQDRSKVPPQSTKRAVDMLAPRLPTVPAKKLLNLLPEELPEGVDPTRKEVTQGSILVTT